MLGISVKYINFNTGDQFLKHAKLRLMFHSVRISGIITIYNNY